MLISPKRLEVDPQMSMIMSVIGMGGKPKEIEPGLFLSQNWNFDDHIKGELLEAWPSFNADNGYYDCCGVCDDFQQVKDRYAQWFNDPDRNYCVSFVRIDKADQPSDGGWRLHKWGEYIGTKDPAYEYIHDEGNDIETVYTFHIFELKGSAQHARALQ